MLRIPACWCPPHSSAAFLLPEAQVQERRPYSRDCQPLMTTPPRARVGALLCSVYGALVSAELFEIVY